MAEKRSILKKNTSSSPVTNLNEDLKKVQISSRNVSQPKRIQRGPSNDSIKQGIQTKPIDITLSSLDGDRRSAIDGEGDNQSIISEEDSAFDDQTPNHRKKRVKPEKNLGANETFGNVVGRKLAPQH